MKTDALGSLQHCRTGQCESLQEGDLIMCT